MRNLRASERPSRGRFRRRRRAAANRSAVSFPTVVGHGPIAERGRADTYTARAMARGPINASRRSSRTARGFLPSRGIPRRVLQRFSLSLSFFLSQLARRFESKRADPAHGRRSTSDLLRGAERAGYRTARTLSREGGQT